MTTLVNIQTPGVSALSRRHSVLPDRRYAYIISSFSANRWQPLRLDMFERSALACCSCMLHETQESTTCGWSHYSTALSGGGVTNDTLVFRCVSPVKVNAELRDSYDIKTRYQARSKRELGSFPFLSKTPRGGSAASLCGVLSAMEGASIAAD